MKENVDSFPIVITRVTDDKINETMFALLNMGGDIVNEEDTFEIAKGLIRFCKYFGKDIDEINEKRNERARQEREEEYKIRQKTL